MMSEVRKRMNAFDLIHFHTDLIHLPFFESIAGRTVTTLHGRLDIKDLAEAYRRWSQYPLVSISDSQRRPLPGVRWAQTVHHGVDGRLFAPPRESARRLPRFSWPDFAGKARRPGVEIAKAAGMPLRIAAKIETLDEHYYEKVKPMLETQASSSSARSATTKNPISWAMPPRCFSRSTGRNPSASS